MRYLKGISIFLRNELIIVIPLRWSWTCPEMETRLRQFADTTVIDGWLELYAAGAESNTNYRIPGTEFKYKCKNGWEREDYTNPDNLIQCQGSRKADFSGVTLKCIRKIHNHSLFALSHLLQL